MVSHVPQSDPWILGTVELAAALEGIDGTDAWPVRSAMLWWVRA